MKKFFTKMICTAFITALCVSNVLAQETYNITVLSSPSAGGIAEGEGTYDGGEDVFVWAMPSTGFQFINWTENGTEVSTNNPYVFTITGDRVLVANFVPVDCEITLSASPPEGGTVSGGDVYSYGDDATITAVPNAEYLFINWTDYDYGYVVSAEAEYTFTVSGPRNLVANFVSAKCDITVSAEPPECGSVTGGGVYTYGETVFVSATANYGFQFKNWTEDGIEVSYYANYQFTASTSRTLVANFVPAKYGVGIVLNPFEGGTASGSGVYTHGEEVSVLAEAYSGYLFVSWTEYGEVLATTPKYVFTIFGGRSLVANFEEGAKVTVLVNMPEGEVLGEGTYHYGDEVTVEAIPNDGYIFTGWTTGRGGLSTDNPYTFTVTESIVLVANFAEDGLLSIESIDAGAMMIYPNPVKDVLTIEDTNFTTEVVKIYDVLGKDVLTGKLSNGTINVSQLSSGTYILKIDGYTVKFVKK